LDAAVTEHGLRDLTLDPEALRLLQHYDWPGNVRELKNTIESAAVLSRGDTIYAKDLPVQIAGEHARPIAAPTAGLFAVGQTLADMERGAILATLDAHGGNRTQAARELGISLRTLQRKLKEYGIQPGAKIEAS
jgi:DNA-binding NtrC family response regulator